MTSIKLNTIQTSKDNISCDEIGRELENIKKFFDEDDILEFDPNLPKEKISEYSQDIKDKIDNLSNISKSKNKSDIHYFKNDLLIRLEKYNTSDNKKALDIINNRNQYLKFLNQLAYNECEYLINNNKFMKDFFSEDPPGILGPDISARGRRAAAHALRGDHRLRARGPEHPQADRGRGRELAADDP